MTTKGWGYSELLWVMVNQWQAEHVPSKDDGYAYIRGEKTIHQYDARLGTAS
jgi:hypothetical protein